MPISASAPVPAPSGQFVLRVFRIDPGQSVVIRTLSKRVEGLATHFCRGKSHFCNPDGCPVAIHKEPRFWKGYAAVEMWFEKPGVWAPYVLEVTEALELDFRRVWKRGQLWQIDRLPVTRQTKPPVTGTLLEERDPDSFPPAFEIIPTVSRLYHAEVSFGVESWIPDRTIVTLTKDAGPNTGKTADGQEVCNKTFAEVAEEMKSKGWRPPAEYRPPVSSRG